MINKKTLPIALVVILLLILTVAISFYKFKNKKNMDNASQSQSAVENPLQVIDLKIGSGKEVKSGDKIEVNYLGTLENGTKFDSSYDRNEPLPLTIGVGQVIKGWDIGILGMKVGGKRKLIIPSNLAYGERGAGGLIPPNATLIFEVELVEISK